MLRMNIHESLLYRNSWGIRSFTCVITIHFQNELLETFKHTMMTFLSTSGKKEEFHARFGIDQDEALFA